MSSRQTYTGRRRWVVKVGSSLVTDQGRGLDLQRIAQWAEQIAGLQAEGRELILVSSGAVAAGMSRLGWRRRPRALHELQAVAALGQMGLIDAYEDGFSRHGLHAAQVLLSYDDLGSRRRYLNARSTLRTLLALRVVPVVNENDTVSTEELRFGDNDTLASLVANLVEAGLLVILTDQAGLFERDPRQDPTAPLVHEAAAGAPALRVMASSGAGTLGRGGMVTKVQAAERAARGGAATVIADGREPDVLRRLAAGEPLGTLLTPGREPLAARKQWIAGQLKLEGALILDDGAVRVLRQAGRSLLPVGVTAVTGDWDRGDVVACRDREGREIARGLVNYTAAECRRLIGVSSQKIEAILGYVGEPELIHRDNMVVF